MTITTNTARLIPAQVDLVSGSWHEPTELLAGTLDDPNTGEQLQPQRATAREVVERAIEAAAKLHDAGSWANASRGIRIELLDLVANRLDRRVDELAYADALATGNPIRVAAQMA